MYHDISMGFELETQQLCLLETKGSRLTLPQEYTKHAFFQHSVEVYNDTFTSSTLFSKTKVASFLDRQSAPASLQVGKYTLQGPWHFNNAEFVVTFARKQSIPQDQLLGALKAHFLKALDKVDQVLREYTPTPLEGDDKSFPYSTVLVSAKKDKRYSPVAFLAQGSYHDFSPEKQSFYYQCTLGFLLEDAIDIFSALAAPYYAHKQIENPWVEKAAVARTIPGRTLQNYLFLFLYSAETRTSRKVGTLFIVRQAFQDLQKVLSVQEKTTLDRWMSTHPDYAYFRSLNFQQVSSDPQQKYTKQALWDVGRIPFHVNERRVFVEFRGFQSLLNHWVGQGPKSIQRVRQAFLPKES